jgi:tRNA U34 5-carboxymethylaminomethyl modifying GTPase MnmE/TrmE
MQDVTQRLCDRLEEGSDVPCRCKHVDSLIIALNKCDLNPALTTHAEWDGDTVCAMSCETMDGVEALQGMLAKRVEQLCSTDTAEAALVTNARHQTHLRVCMNV